MGACLRITTLEQCNLPLSKVSVSGATQGMHYRKLILSILDRPLEGRDRAIAKAAAVSGFDCSDIDRLMTLVNAVRTADAGSTYPDYYRGESTRESDFAPARKRHRQNAYRDLDNPAVPAFGMTHEQILRGVRQFGASSDFMGYMGTHVVEASHRQTINLYNKRTSGDNYWPPTTKKLKASASQTMHDQVIIDLTQDNSPEQNLPVIAETHAPNGNHIHPSRRGMVSGTNASRHAATSEQSRRQRGAKNRGNQTRTQTTKVLENISNTLSAQTAQIVSARDKLRQRWDVDHRLQLQAVTDRLTVLNKAFGIMEETGRDAVHLIRDQLMQKERGNRGMFETFVRRSR